MDEWLAGGVYLLGVLHAIPAWYFGRAYASRQRPGRDSNPRP